MTRAEVDMLAFNGVLFDEKTHEDYKDLSIQEVLEAEYGSIAPYIKVDETLTIPPYN